jgi:hypothetical protein
MALIQVGYDGGGEEAMSVWADVKSRDEMIRELREALKFYADERNYHSRGGVEDVQNSVVDSDNGTIARDALGEKKR